MEAYFVSLDLPNCSYNNNHFYSINQGCKKVIQSLEGLIQSNEYPSFYKRGTCTYIFKAQENAIIMIDFLQIEVGVLTSNSCSDDKIEVRTCKQAYILEKAFLHYALFHSHFFHCFFFPCFFLRF